MLSSAQMAEQMIAARKQKKFEEMQSRPAPQRSVTSANLATQMIAQKQKEKEAALLNPQPVAKLEPLAAPTGRMSSKNQAQMMIRSKTAQKLSVANDLLMANAKPAAAPALNMVPMPVHTQLAPSDVVVMTVSPAPTTPAPAYDSVSSVLQPESVVTTVSAAPAAHVALAEQHAALVAQQSALQRKQAELFQQQQALAQQQARVSQQLGEVQLAMQNEQAQQQQVALAAAAAAAAAAADTNVVQEFDETVVPVPEEALPAHPVDAAVSNGTFTTLDFAAASAESESARIAAELVQMTVEGSNIGTTQLRTSGSHEAKKVRFEL